MSNQELNCIKKACSITDKIFRELILELKKHSFDTEKDIARFIIRKTKENNCKLAFKPIIASNDAEIHHKPKNKNLKKGFLIVDFGVKYKGYCSDCTRTFYIGKPSKKEIKLYNNILSAQEIGIIYANPGRYAADVDLIVRSALLDYYKNFVHGTGHGVGKKIHQSPTLKPRSRSILRKNQVITIEPGIYFKKKYGIRIEDTVIVNNIPLVLTKTTKKLIII